MIEVEQRGQVSIIHMKHGKANAQDIEFCEALTARLEMERETAAQALVLIGQGRIFSAGVDLVRIVEGGPSYVAAFLPALRTLFETLFCYPKIAPERFTGVGPWSQARGS